MAPPRGSPDWFTYQYKASPSSPSYWTHYHCRKGLKDWTLETNNSPFHLKDVGKATYDTIEKLVQDTWQKDNVGKGRDAQGLDNFTRIQVKKVERVENCMLFLAYFNKRQELFKKGIRKGTFKQLENLSNSSGQILTTKMVPRDSALAKDLYTEVNEHYMFHGTQASVVDTIMKQGLDSRLAGNMAMFGQGVYTAESSTKSDQYAGKW